MSQTTAWNQWDLISESWTNTNMERAKLDAFCPQSHNLTFAWYFLDTAIICTPLIHIDFRTTALKHNVELFMWHLLGCTYRRPQLDMDNLASLQICKCHSPTKFSFDVLVLYLLPNCLVLSCRIENDKVESYSITQSFNKQENWTKALKYTLCNLKWVLYWFVGNTNFQPLSATVSSQAEVPAAAGSLYSKQPTNTKFQS